MATYHGLNEDETCRTFVLPAFVHAGWRNDQVRPQYRINEGRLVATSHYHAHSEPLIADYVLEYGKELPIGVVVAKRTRAHAADGVEQTKSRLFQGCDDLLCRPDPALY
jgi:type I restriction enzyme, R subunit